MKVPFVLAVVAAAVGLSATPATADDLTFDTARHTATGEKPSAPREFVFLFDNSIWFNPYAFPTCSRAQLAEQACPPGAQVGSGRATFYPAGTSEVLRATRP